MSFAPKDSEGRTAWDYAAGIWRELCAIREALTDNPDDSITRFLSAMPETPMDGVALEAQAAVTVPPGFRWEALGVSGYSGIAATNRMRIHRNIKDPSGFLTVGFATGGYYTMMTLPDNVVLEENTRLLFVFVFDAAPALGTWPVANLVCRQVPYGNPPQETQQAGSAIALESEWLATDVEPRAEVHYAG